MLFAVSAEVISNPKKTRENFSIKHRRKTRIEQGQETRL
jgi:hypothetical protein